MERDRFLSILSHLNVYARGERRAPHKPLLVLVALGEFAVGNDRIDYAEAAKKLKPLLNNFAPPVRGRHQPELPYWHLQSDGIWKVEYQEPIERQSGGFPRISALRATRAGFSAEVLDLLWSNPSIVLEAVAQILETYFPHSIHDDIASAVGLTDAHLSLVAEVSQPLSLSRSRDPNFRNLVLRAYDYRCAVTGFQVALGGSYFGCEAAHVRWHAYDGPDSVSNGLSLEPTMHKLFDSGAWSLTDDLRVLVSSELTGSDTTIGQIRALHGQPIRQPISGAPPVSIEHIRWHRDEKKGGVFRAPALPL